jgi:hypothetical protein
MDPTRLAQGRDEGSYILVGQPEGKGTPWKTEQ